MNSAAPKNSGFTLLEVLVALAILAIGLVAAIRAGIASSDTASALRDRQLAGWVAENQLALLRARRSAIAVGEHGGETTMAGQSFAWQVSVKSLPYTALRQVDITVSAPGERNELSRLSGYLGNR